MAEQCRQTHAQSCLHPTSRLDGFDNLKFVDQARVLPFAHESTDIAADLSTPVLHLDEIVQALGPTDGHPPRVTTAP